MQHSADHHRADIIGYGAARTIPGLFRERVARSPDAIAYREWDAAVRQWQDYSWRDMARLVRRCQVALCGAALEQGDRVAVQLPNGTGWVAFDIAAMASGLVTVPIYSHDSLGNAAHILANSGARLLVLDTWEQWAALAPWASRFPALRHVWIRQARTVNAANGPASLAVASLADALSSTTEAIREPELAADATATLIYTSGTTGPPKASCSPTSPSFGIATRQPGSSRPCPATCSCHSCRWRTRSSGRLDTTCP